MPDDHVAQALEAHSSALLDLLDYHDGSGNLSTYTAVTVHWDDAHGSHTLNWSRAHEGPGTSELRTELNAAFDDEGNHDGTGTGD